MARALFCILLVWLIVPVFVAAEDSAGDKKKKAEEALREEAAALATTIQQPESLISLRGRFTLAKELAVDDKPLPKVVGYISSSGVVYPVMAPQRTALDTLAGLDHTDVSISGRILDKGDQGLFFVVTTINISSGVAPRAMKKRGGI